MNLETCADCGEPITMGQGSYYRPDANGGMGKSFHSECGDPLGTKAAVASERERCAKIAEGLAEFMGEAYERLCHTIAAHIRSD